MEYFSTKIWGTFRLTNTYCDTERNTKVIKCKETYSVRGEGILVDARIALCTFCGEEILDEGLDSLNLQDAYDVYRTKHDILSPEDIVQS